MVLTNLAKLGYIYRDGEAIYRLTSKFYNIGNKSIGTSVAHEAVITTSKKHLYLLRDKTGLSVHLATIEGSNVFYLDKIESEDFVKFDTFVGKRAPIHLTAVGRALLLTLSDSNLEPLLKALDYSRGNNGNLSDPKILRKRIEEYRKLGYATEKEEEADGVECIAAPIIAKNLTQSYSVGVIGLTNQLKDKDVKKIATNVVRIAKDIASELIIE